MPIYVWSWKREDGSDRHVEITTSMGLETARQRACSLFPGEEEYINTHDPEVK